MLQNLKKAVIVNWMFIEEIIYRILTTSYKKNVNHVNMAKVNGCMHVLKVRETSAEYLNINFSDRKSELDFLHFIMFGEVKCSICRLFQMILVCARTLQ